MYQCEVHCLRICTEGTAVPNFMDQVKFLRDLKDAEESRKWKMSILGRRMNVFPFFTICYVPLWRN